MQVLYVCTNFVYTYTCASIQHVYASLYINCLDNKKISNDDTFYAYITENQTIRK